MQKIFNNIFHYLEKLDSYMFLKHFQDLNAVIKEKKIDKESRFDFVRNCQRLKIWLSQSIKFDILEMNKSWGEKLENFKECRNKGTLL